MKLVIAGTRTFTGYPLLFNTLLGLHIHYKITEVVSGSATGADRLGEIWASHNKIKVTKFFPDWERQGKGAGPIRNAKMAEYGDMVIVFWNGVSRGTKSMIDCAIRHRKHCIVVNYISGKTIEYETKPITIKKPKSQALRKNGQP